MYGFIGRITGHSLQQLLTVSGMGDIRQHLFRADDPEDVAATTFGWELADEHMNIDEVSIDWSELNMMTFYNEFISFRNLNIMTKPTQNLQPYHTPFVLTEPERRR